MITFFSVGCNYSANYLSLLLIKCLFIQQISVSLVNKRISRKLSNFLTFSPVSWQQEAAGFMAFLCSQWPIIHGAWERLLLFNNNQSVAKIPLHLKGHLRICNLASRSILKNFNIQAFSMKQCWCIINKVCAMHLRAISQKFPAHVSLKYVATFSASFDLLLHCHFHFQFMAELIHVPV